MGFTTKGRIGRSGGSSRKPRQRWRGGGGDGTAKAVTTRKSMARVRAMDFLVGVQGDALRRLYPELRSKDRSTPPVSLQQSDLPTFARLSFAPKATLRESPWRARTPLWNGRNLCSAVEAAPFEIPRPKSQWCECAHPGSADGSFLVGFRVGLRQWRLSLRRRRQGRVGLRNPRKGCRGLVRGPAIRRGR